MEIFTHLFPIIRRAALEGVRIGFGFEIVPTACRLKPNTAYFMRESATPTLATGRSDEPRLKATVVLRGIDRPRKQVVRGHMFLKKTTVCPTFDLGPDKNGENFQRRLIAQCRSFFP